MEHPRSDGLRNPESLFVAARAAETALTEGGHWPEDAWVEYILMIGANACAAAVLNHNLYFELKETCGTLYQSVLDRRWLHGGPNGVLEPHEVQGLGQAAGQREFHQAPSHALPVFGSSDSERAPARKRWFGQ